MVSGKDPGKDAFVSALIFQEAWFCSIVMSTHLLDFVLNFNRDRASTRKTTTTMNNITIAETLVTLKTN